LAGIKEIEKKISKIIEHHHVKKYVKEPGMEKTISIIVQGLYSNNSKSGFKENQVMIKFPSIWNKNERVLNK